MTQQVKSGTPAHRALDCFQVADLPFHRAGTPGQRQSGSHRSQVTPQPTDESDKKRSLSRDKPVIQPLLLLLADHRSELPGQVNEMGEFSGTGNQSVNEPPLRFIDLVGIGDNQPGCPPAARGLPRRCRFGETEVRRRVGGSQPAQPVPHGARSAGKATLPDFPPEPDPIVAAFVPATAQIVAMNIDRAVSGGLLPTRQSSAFQPDVYRSPVQAEGGGDPAPGPAFRVEGDHLVKTSLPCCLLVQAVLLTRRWGFG